MGTEGAVDLEHFDLFVIGAGPGGYVAALEAAKLGRTVAVAERREVGGTCLNRGCIPTKALLRAAKVYRQAVGSAELGVTVTGAACDMEAMYRHVGEVTASLRGGIEALFKSGGVRRITGSARVEGPGKVTVDGQAYAADHILLAAGSKPARPPIPGLDLPGVVTSDELLAGRGADAKRLVVIGGGVVGVEFAQIFNDLGRQVTVLEALPRILNNMDREISQNLNMILKKRGVAVHAGASVTEIATDGIELVCRYREKDAEAEVRADCVLVCTGRRPETEGVFAPGVGPVLERGYLRVDDDFETGMEGVYAVGDIVAGGVQLAHAAENQAKNAVRAMFGQEKPKDLTVMPACVFTDPEIATVGITADEAKAAGRSVVTHRSLTSANGKSVVEGAARGFAKLVFDAESGVLVGAQLMCPHASEMIGGLSAAISAGLTKAQLSKAVLPHPTVSEILDLA